MPLETINEVVCTGCSILCDDIAIDVQFGKIQMVYNACLRGSKKFEFSGSKSRLKEPLICSGWGDDQTATTYKEALEKAKQIIDNGKDVWITNLMKTDNETQTLIFNMLRDKNIKIAVPDYTLLENINKLIISCGFEFFTLGEVINNADLIMFWGANPIDLGPKLVVKTVFSRGRYRQSGKEVKKFVVIDDYPTPTMERADIKLLIDTSQDEIILKTIILKLLDEKIISEEDLNTIGYNKADLENVTDLPQNVLENIDELIKTIRYMEYFVLFLGEGILNNNTFKNNECFLRKLLLTVKVLNKRARVSYLPVFYKYNYHGLIRELVISKNKENIIDFHESLKLGSVPDVIIAVGSDFISELDLKSIEKLKNTSIITLDYKESPTTKLSRVVIPVKMNGIETMGYVTRFDGTILKLNPALDRKDGMLSDRDVLKTLLS
ncbi:MAG: hypothetical protein ACTSWN_09720 [Promethearchaeota archaeon]